MSDTTTRPKAVRTYGSRRAEAEATDVAGPSATREKLYESLSTMRRSPSPVVDSATPSPTKESATDSPDFFGWKSKMRDIDEGLEDDNLENLIRTKHASASASPAPTSIPGSPSHLPLFIDTAPSTPATPSPLKTNQRQSLSPLASRTRTASPSGSPTRKQISSLSISSPESVFKPSTSRSIERSAGDIENDSDDAAPVPKRRSGKVKVSGGGVEMCVYRNQLTRPMNPETV